MSADNDDLEALFDQISSETLARLDALPVTSDSTENDLSTQAKLESTELTDDLYQRIGLLTRQLHDALRALGLENDVENAVNAMPDARQRLDYIAKLTGQAAERALQNVEQGHDVTSKLGVQAGIIEGQWRKMFAKELSVDEFKNLAQDTYSFMSQMPEALGQMQDLLTDIMMAQDFHDLTGQVIQKVVSLAQNIEESLVRLLVDATPPEKRQPQASSESLEGPVVSVVGRDDVVTSQEQVDDLLESLGF